MVTDHDMMASRREGAGLRSVPGIPWFMTPFMLISEGKPNIRPGVVTQKNYIIPGQLFDASDVQQNLQEPLFPECFQNGGYSFQGSGGGDPMLDCDVLDRSGHPSVLFREAGGDQLGRKYWCSSKPKIPAPKPFWWIGAI